MANFVAHVISKDCRTVWSGPFFEDATRIFQTVIESCKRGSRVRWDHEFDGCPTHYEGHVPGCNRVTVRRFGA